MHGARPNTMDAACPSLCMEPTLQFRRRRGIRGVQKPTLTLTLTLTQSPTITLTLTLLLTLSLNPYQNRLSSKHWKTQRPPPRLRHQVRRGAIWFQIELSTRGVLLGFAMLCDVISAMAEFMVRVFEECYWDL
jgi:hypothetical protein